MDRNKFEDWVRQILSGSISAARVKVQKAGASVGDAQEKIEELKRIVDSSSTLKEAKKRAFEAGLITSPKA